MRGEWCYFKSYFTKEECDKIVKDGGERYPGLLKI